MTYESPRDKIPDREEMLRICLKQVRDNDTIPTTILSNGQSASRFSFEYILSTAKNNSLRRNRKKGGKHN